MTRIRLSFALLALAALFIGGPADGLEAADAGISGDTSAAISGEPRLRKLHLVRPDLIPYPLAVEHFC